VYTPLQARRGGIHLVPLGRHQLFQNPKLKIANWLQENPRKSKKIYINNQRQYGGVFTVVTKPVYPTKVFVMKES
jgi:hypothetical protein